MNNNDIYQPLAMTLADKWREQYNPLTALTMRQITGWLYEQQLGIVSNITWLYEFIERRHPTLMACVQRRTSAMERLSWSIKTTPEDELPQGCTKAMAEKQATFLRGRYQLIDNVTDAVSWMALANFRGYAHLEKHYDAQGRVTHLESVPQWNWARAGRTGDWWYNKRADQVFADPLAISAQLTAIDHDDFLIREVPYPIDEVAVFAFFRSMLAQKDWDGFIATFGIPPLFIVMPPNMPVDQQAAYQALAERVISNARGTLPNGADVKTVDNAGKGQNPFLEHMKYQNEMIVLSSTGGKLTMLAESGSGNLAGGAHQDSFDDIAEADGIKISQIFNIQFDQVELAKAFPGQPVLAKFHLEGREEVDAPAVVSQVKDLAVSGWKVDGDQIEEKTGWRVTAAPPTGGGAAGAGGPPLPPGSLSNRRRKVSNRQGDDAGLRALLDAVTRHINGAQPEAYAPILNRCNALLEVPDADYPAACRKLMADLPSLLEESNTSDADVRAWQEALAPVLVTGLSTTTPKSTQNRFSALLTRFLPKKRPDRP